MCKGIKENKALLLASVFEIHKRLNKKEKDHSAENSSIEASALSDDLKAAETRILELEAALTDMTFKYESAVDALSRISEIASSIE